MEAQLLKESLKQITKINHTFIDHIEEEFLKQYPNQLSVLDITDHIEEDTNLQFDFNNLKINPNPGMSHPILSRFYIIRHGETDSNRSLAGGGLTKPKHKEAQLTELGYLQSYLTGIQLSKHMVNGQTYEFEVSAMIRALETLILILLGIMSRKQIKVNLLVDDKMIEIRGHKITDYHGLTKFQFKDLFEQLSKNDYLNYQLSEGITDKGYWFKNDGIETSQEFLERIRDKYYGDWIYYQQTTIVIGHSIWISKFISSMESDNSDSEFHLANLSINVFDLTASEKTKGKFSREWHKISYTSHLPIKWRTGHHIPQI